MQPYTVEDQYVTDPGPPADAWASYLSARFSKRKELYEGLSAREKEGIRKELRRIQYLREYFDGHRLSSADNSPLVASLEKSHRAWRDRATRRCKEDLQRCEVAIAQATGYRRKELNRHHLILQQVQQWPTQQYAHLQQSLAPESYIKGLDADDGIEDDPVEPNYGYSGWVIAFKKGEGGVTLDHPLCHGKFPHQKVTMQKLLYDRDGTPFKRSADRTQLRYFHLQANNMRWVEDAVARYYGEEDSALGSQRGLYRRNLFQPTPSKSQTNTEKLLKRELWHGQERGGGNSSLPAQSRQIRPRCAFRPSPSQEKTGQPRDSTGYFHSAHEAQDVVLFMPYLHWEIEKRLVRMTNVIRQTKRMNDQESALERLEKRNGTWGSMVDRAKARARRLERTPSDLGAWTDESPSWRPQSPLGLYLWHAAKLFQLVDEAADWRLISEHLCTQSPLHPRRTLEQYYNWTADDTAHRDRQQVVYRGTRNDTSNDPESVVPRVVMVDQLWMLILDENTILTAFPRRWGRNKPDPSAVHRAIRDHLGAVDSSQITSIYDLALIIVDECSKVFFDRTKPDLRPEVVDMFGSAISNISEKKTEAYERFGRDVKRMNSQDPLQTAEEFLRKSLSIKFEWSVLMEAQNVIDQLQIMQEIFTQQITAMGDFEKALRNLSLESHNDGLKNTLERAAELMLDMKQRRDELANLEKRQANTRAQLRELLDMKQQQSGIIEAKAAIRRADESVVQGRSIVVFTVVTIFFLPLSFFATLFGMNARELNDGTMSLGTQMIWMFVLSSVVICLSLGVAFSAWARGAIVATFDGLFRILARPVKKRKSVSDRLTSASPHVIREFMIAKQKEWEGRHCGNGMASGSLPLHRGPTSTGNGKGVSSGVIERLWRGKSAMSRSSKVDA